ASGSVRLNLAQQRTDVRPELLPRPLFVLGQLGDGGRLADAGQVRVPLPEPQLRLRRLPFLRVQGAPAPRPQVSSEPAQRVPPQLGGGGGVESPRRLSPSGRGQGGGTGGLVAPGAPARLPVLRVRPTNETHRAEVAALAEEHLGELERLFGAGRDCL